MILSRAPLRITFGGGGTDLIDYSSKYGGFCLSAAINKYVYVAVNRTIQNGIKSRYSKNESADTISEIEHPIIRESLSYLNYETPQMEIVSMADVPSNGAGLGNSGSFTVALLKSLYANKNIPVSSYEIAKVACDININKLNFIQGKQDEYISSVGGVMSLQFDKDGSVEVRPLKIKYDTLVDLEENLMLFYTGISHSTNEILKHQKEKSKENDKDMIDNLNELKQIGYDAKKHLEDGDVNSFAESINLQWENKKRRSPGMTNSTLEEVRDGMLKNGGFAVKLVGSGGGGFYLCYANNKSKLRHFMRKIGITEMRFGFDFEGVKQLV